MSTMSMIAEDEPQDFPKVPPSEVSSLMAAWWLVIGFSLVVYLAILPLAPAPLAEKDTVLEKGWLIFGGLAALLLIIGTFVGIGMRRGKPGSLRLCKLGLIFGIMLEIGAVAAVLVLASGKPAATPSPGAPATPAASASGIPLPLGPAPTLGMILLAFVVLLPICFSILAFSLSASMGVKDWFHPPVEEQPAETAGGWSAAGAGLGAAMQESARIGLEEAPAGLDAAPLEHFEAPVEHAAHPDFDATVPPEFGPQPFPGVGRPTMIASDEEVTGAVHDEAEAEPDAFLDAESAAAPSARIPASPEETPVDSPDAELAAAAAVDGEEVVYVEEIEAQEGDALEYVVEEVPGGEVVEAVMEDLADVEELPSAEADAGEGTDVKPVETWDFMEGENDKDGKHKKK